MSDLDPDLVDQLTKLIQHDIGVTLFAETIKNQSDIVRFW